MKHPKRVLGTFTLAMITAAAIISLRNLPGAAVFGFSSVFYFGVAALIFFIPIALATAELAAGWPHAGGAYVWVSEAFGKKWGFFALWAAWMGIIAWFPAILAFTATMLAHLIAPVFPGFEESKPFYFAVMFVVFWGATFLNFLGIQTSSWISSLGVLSGTVIPGALIIVLGIWWVLAGHDTHIVFSTQTLIPDFQLETMVLFAGILLGFVGVEVAAYHVKEAKEPQKEYPRAIAIAAIFILVISIVGTLSIAMVVPQKEISLLSGLIQGFTVFLSAFDLVWAVPILALLLLIGSLAGINTWIVGPAKGLLVTAQDGFLPPSLARVNDKGVPTGMLIFQATIGTILSFVFLFMDSHSAAFWVLTALSAQFAVVQYGFVFAAVLRLRYSQPHTHRAYRVPGGKAGLWLIALVGIAACAFGFWIGFVPPSQLETGDKTTYQTLLGACVIILSCIPLVFSLKRRFRRKKA